MQAIKTTYHGPTAFQGARIKAVCEAGSVTIPYPYEKGQGEPAHAVAALKLCKKLGWTGVLVAGGLKDCYVFVFSTRTTGTFNFSIETYAAEA